MWLLFISSEAAGSPGLQRRMNHGREAWHTPQAKGTSSLKSLRKRPLPSLPAKPECRAKVRDGEEMPKLQNRPAASPPHPCPPVSPAGIAPGDDAALLLAIPRLN